MNLPMPETNPPKRRRFVWVAALVAAAVCVGVLVALGAKPAADAPSSDAAVSASLTDAPAQAAALDPASAQAEVPEPEPEPDSPYAAGPVEDDRVIEDEMVRGEILVSADDPGDVPEEGSALAGTVVTGVETISEDDGSVIAKIELADGDKRDAAMEEIEGTGAAAQPNFIYRLMDAPEDETVTEPVSTPPNNDPSANRQYSYLPWIDGTLSGAPNLDDAKMGSDVYTAWSLYRSNHKVTVAVIDTGCQTEHPDLTNNIDKVHMKDIFSGYAAGHMWDYAGHGTHVCGIVGAEADNGIGVAGASYNATVLPIKVFDNNTVSPGASTYDIAKAYDYLDELIDTKQVENLRVANMSLGGYGRSAADDVLEGKIEALRKEHGVLTVCAGGNGDSKNNIPYTDPSYPSDYDCVLSVTSLAPNGDDSVWSDYNEAKDISAPGEDILSTYLNSYTPLSGTSMATPLVSGVAGLLFSADPTLTPDDVSHILTQSVHIMRMTQAHGKRIAIPGAVKTGSTGALNAEKALRYVLEDRLHVKEYITAADVELVGGTSFPYDNVGREAQEPEVKVVHNGVELVQDRDYTIRYVNNVRPGTASVIVEGILPNYAGCVNVNFEITIDETNRTDIAGLTFAGVPEGGVTYNGGAFTPLITVTDTDGYELEEDLDYTIAYSDNVNAGTARITIKGISVYKGEKELTFEIHKAKAVIYLDVTTLNTREDMAAQEIHIFGPNVMDYTATSSQSEVAEASIKHEWANMAKYYDNAVVITPKSKGETEISLTGSSPNYEEMNTVTFKVIVAGKDEGIVAGTNDIANATIDVDSAGLVYDGNPHMAKITVSYEGTTLVPGTAYHASYANYTNAGEATIYISGNAFGGWSGMTRRTYTIAKAVPQPKLSRSSITFPEGANYTESVTVSVAQIGLEQPLIASATSSSDDVCTAELRDGTVIITPHGPGSATVSVKTAETPNLAEGEGVISVRVGKAEVEPPTPVDPPAPVAPKPSTLAVSPTSLTLKMGETGTLRVSGANGPVTVSSTAQGVIGTSLSDDGATITVTPKSVGQASILVTCPATSEYRSGSVSVPVTVDPASTGGGGGGGSVTPPPSGGGGGTVTPPPAEEPGDDPEPEPSDVEEVASEITSQETLDTVNEAAGSVATVTAETTPSQGGSGTTGGNANVTWTIAIQDEEAPAEEVSQGPVKGIVTALTKSKATWAELEGSSSVRLNLSNATQRQIQDFCEKCVDITLQKKARTQAASGETAGELVDVSFTLKLTGADSSTAYHTLRFTDKNGAKLIVYRLYNPGNKAHHLTSDKNEYDTLIREAGWKGEGKAWTAPSTSNTPIYRLYNPTNGDHHFTSDKNEYDTLIREAGWKGEGVAMYGAEPGKAVYRVWNPNMKENGGAFSHHWTSDENEYQTLGKQGWRQENIAWYGLAE